MPMTIRWRSIATMAGALAAAALIVYASGLVIQRDRQAQLTKTRGTDTLLPLATGFSTTSGAVDPSLHCVPLPPGIGLAHQPTSKAWMDSHFHGYADWTVISDRMAQGDDIYAYHNVSHPPPGVTMFTGAGGGFVVLRGWCLVGRFNTWVE